MKRWIVTIVVATLILTIITACNGNESSHSIPNQPDEAATLTLTTEPSTTPEPITSAAIDTTNPTATTIESAEANPPIEKPDLPTPIPTPMVALTFDDGPSRHTDSILDTLELHDGKATFFVVGNRVETYRTTVERAVNLGNEIANHTQTHPRLTSQTDGEIKNEIQSASNAIASIIGTSPLIYRPPFGATDERVLNISAELGYGIVKWTIDPLDWRDRDADTIYNRIMSQVEDGSVIVLHDIHLTTAQAMERVIPSLIDKGFQLVTVSELLERRYGGLAAGSVFGTYCSWRIWDAE